MPTHRYDAHREIRAKSDRAIERETALKWAARADACYQQHRETGLTRWLIRAEDYAREALEHGAQVGDRGNLVGELQARLDRARGKKR